MVIISASIVKKDWSFDQVFQVKIAQGMSWSAVHSGIMIMITNLPAFGQSQGYISVCIMRIIGLYQVLTSQSAIFFKTYTSLGKVKKRQFTNIAMGSCPMVRVKNLRKKILKSLARRWKDLLPWH